MAISLTGSVIILAFNIRGWPLRALSTPVKSLVVREIRLLAGRGRGAGNRLSWVVSTPSNGGSHSCIQMAYTYWRSLGNSPTSKFTGAGCRGWLPRTAPPHHRSTTHRRLPPPALSLHGWRDAGVSLRVGRDRAGRAGQAGLRSKLEPDVKSGLRLLRRIHWSGWYAPTHFSLMGAQRSEAGFSRITVLSTTLPENV